MTSRRPPASVRRQLRKEANFGCVICGAPVIEYHHIIPYSEEEHHDPDQMVVLCRNHHAEAGPDAEAITADQLHKHKENPHNSERVEYDFYFESNTPFMRFGGNFFQLKDENRMTILRIADQPLLEVTYENDMLQFSALLFDDAGSPIAKLNQNEWWAEADGVWDLEYRNNQFTIWHQRREIGLKVEYDSDTDLISMRGSFYAQNGHVQAFPSKTEFRDIGARIVGHKVVDGKVAMWYTNMDGPWEVLVGVDPRIYGKELRYI